jgi:hypothetical protein
VSVRLKTCAIDFDLVSDLREAPTITQRNAKSRRQNDAWSTPLLSKHPQFCKFLVLISGTEDENQPSWCGLPRLWLLAFSISDGPSASQWRHSHQSAISVFKSPHGPGWCSRPCFGFVICIQRRLFIRPSNTFLRKLILPCPGRVSQNSEDRCRYRNQC